MEFNVLGLLGARNSNILTYCLLLACGATYSASHGFQNIYVYTFLADMSVEQNLALSSLPSKYLLKIMQYVIHMLMQCAI